jgi:hypothetical protein
MRAISATLSGVNLSHRSNLQFTGILLSGHQHGSPPFNVAGPLISCLTFGVHSTTPLPGDHSSPYGGKGRLDFGSDHGQAGSNPKVRVVDQPPTTAPSYNSELATGFEFKTGMLHEKTNCFDSERRHRSDDNCASAWVMYVRPFTRVAAIDDFHFRSGEVMPELRLHYYSAGQPLRDAQGHVTNAVMIVHPTTVEGGWYLRNKAFVGELFGPGQVLDANRYYIIAPDAIRPWQIEQAE